MKYIFTNLFILFFTINSYSKALDLDISGSYTLAAYSLFQSTDDSSGTVNFEHAFAIQPSWLILDHWSLHSRLDFLSSDLENGKISLRKNFKSGITKIEDTFLSELYLKYAYKNHGGHIGLRPLSFGLGLTHNDTVLISSEDRGRLVSSSQPSLAYWFKLGSIKVEAWHLYFEEDKEEGEDTTYKSASTFKLFYGGENWGLNYLYYKDLKFSAHNVFVHKKTSLADTSLEFVLSSPLKGEEYTQSAALLNVDWGFNFSKDFIKVNNTFIYASGDVDTTEDSDESYSFSSNKFIGNLFNVYGGVTNTIATSMGIEKTFFKHFVCSTSLLYAQALEGVNKDLGFELSTSVSYSFNEKLSWFNQLYFLLPGSVLESTLPKNSLGFYSAIAINF